MLHEGGSEGKNTAVKGSDIDIVVQLQGAVFNHKEVPGHCSQALDALRSSHSFISVKKVHDHGNFGMQVNLKTATDHRDMDILFTGDPKDNQHGNPDQCYK